MAETEAAAGAAEPEVPAAGGEDAAAAAAAAGGEDIEAMFGGALKKKKKKKKKKDKGDDEEAGTGSADGGGKAGAGGAAGGSVDDPDLTYDDMLGRVYAKIHANNPELTDRQKMKLKPPQVMRVGTTRTCWVNFTEICKMMNRQPDHLLSYVLTELGTTGAIDGSSRLVLKGKFMPRGVENLLRNYITDYVMCEMCKSLNTVLSRDPVSRLFFMNCKSCGSQRSVAIIKAGFTAVRRGERRKQRA